jgi:uncharacterized protein involved in exopolysaccharide biosynthesis
MDLMTLPARLWRRWWVVLAVVAVTGLGLALRTATTQPAYEAQVRILFTAPPVDDVSLLGTGNRSSSFLRDDLTLARNNFLVVLRSREAFFRTAVQLGLHGQDADYQVVARPLRDSDFTDVVVSARSPDLARRIADAHVAQAVQLYGELRAKSAAATRALLDRDLRSAAERLRAYDGAAAGATASGAAGVDAASSEDLRQARETYQLLLRKQAEASLAADNALLVGNIHVVEPALTPEQPTWKQGLVRLVGLWLVGSLVLGSLLALLLDSLSSRARPGRTSAGEWPDAHPPVAGRPEAGSFAGPEPVDQRRFPAPHRAASRLFVAAAPGPEQVSG